MKSLLDICYCEEWKLSLDMHLPECDAFPVFVYFHGGSLSSGDKANANNLFQYLVSKGIAVVSANYRMYPEAKYPDFLCDAAKVIAWVVKNIGDYGDAEGIYVGGSSAGGYISQMMCFDGRYLAKQGIRTTDIAGFVHDAGQPTCHFNVLNERGLDTRRVIIDEAAPIYHVHEKEKYPPMLIIVSDDDLPNRYEQTMLLVSTLKYFGNVENVELRVMKGQHCSYVNKLDQNGISILGRLVCEFIKEN